MVGWWVEAHVCTFALSCSWTHPTFLLHLLPQPISDLVLLVPTSWPRSQLAVFFLVVVLYTIITTTTIGRSWSRPVAGWSVNNSNGEVAKECWWSMSVGWLVYWFFCPALFLGRQAPSLPTGTDSDRNPTSSYVMSLCNGQHQERTGGIRPGQYTSFISSYSDYYYHRPCHQPSLPSFHSPIPLYGAFT